MSEAKILNDKFFIKDSISQKSHPQTLWARTHIMGGYGRHRNKLGISELDEVVFEAENLVPLVGVQYAMESIFGVSGTLSIPTLNDKMHIGAQNSSVVPTGDNPYAYGQKVCLFGVGIGGAAQNNLTALEVKYNETGINTIEFPNSMVPFRFTNDELSSTDKLLYYGKKDVENTKAYYLKRFDSDPEIHHIYNDGEEEETEVKSDFFELETNLPVQSFTDCLLTITQKDIREYFDHFNDIDVPRVNSFGLFTAVYDKDQEDYAQIQLFSKLNIPTETLTLAKDMNIIYRVYGA